MIRVIIILLFLFIIWVLYASGFDKPRKIRISIIAVVFCLIAFWFDGYDKRQISNLVSLENVKVCGLSAEYSYRTNFDFKLCVRNTAEKGTLSRIDFAVIAQDCRDDECTEIQRVERSTPIDVAPQQESSLEQNISFDKVDPDSKAVQWSALILKTKAHR